MKIRVTRLRKLAYATLALSVLGAVSVPALAGSVSAAGQATERSVQLSTATPAATAAKYTISFKPVTTTTIGGIVVDFCGDSPIIGSTTCTLPTAFTLGTSVTLTASYTGMGSGWATTNSLQGAAAASNKQVAILTNATPQSLTAGSAVTFELTGITNPSSTGTFYARIYTFDTSANTTSQYTATSTTRAALFANRVDYGGAAMSTNLAVNISAVVQEQLTFCVSAASPGTGCSGVTQPDVSLGTGTPKVLTTGTVQAGTVYHQITTNAVNNVNVRLKNTSSATCAGLSRDNGTTCDIIANGAFAAIGSSAGKFGLNVSGGAGGTGTVTANSNYGSAAATYGMANATYGPYGDIISTSAGAVTDVVSTMIYAANAAPTTPAGVYQATHSLIATGSY